MQQACDRRDGVPTAGAQESTQRGGLVHPPQRCRSRKRPAVHSPGPSAEPLPPSLDSVWVGKGGLDSKRPRGKHGHPTGTWPGPGLGAAGQRGRRSRPHTGLSPNTSRQPSISPWRKLGLKKVFHFLFSLNNNSALQHGIGLNCRQETNTAAVHATRPRGWKTHQAGRELRGGEPAVCRPNESQARRGLHNPQARYPEAFDQQGDTAPPPSGCSRRKGHPGGRAPDGLGA